MLLCKTPIASLLLGFGNAETSPLYPLVKSSAPCAFLQELIRVFPGLLCVLGTAGSFPKGIKEAPGLPPQVRLSGCCNQLRLLSWGQCLNASPQMWQGPSQCIWQPVGHWACEPGGRGRGLPDLSKSLACVPSPGAEWHVLLSSRGCQCC